MVAAGVLALACAALLGIQETVAVVLRQGAGGTTTVITTGLALLGLWAVAVLREEGGSLRPSPPPRPRESSSCWAHRRAASSSWASPASTPSLCGSRATTSSWWS